MPTTIILLRHAQGTHNADTFNKGVDRYTDPVYLDAELTEEGIKQTQDVRATLQNDQFDAIYCSPLRRTRKTLLGVYPQSEQIPVNLVDALLEQPAGHNICDKRLEKSDIQVPERWDCSGVADVNPFVKKPHAAALQEIRQFTEQIRSLYPNGTVLFVTHYNWIYNWTKIYTDKGESVGNCEMLRIILGS
jgi:broad specificity phosphatase PhoE